VRRGHVRDDEDGRQVYEVEVLDPEGNEHDLEIDATSRAVLHAEADDDSDDDSDD
jgi:uncharacterized membrane protein YkoI